jgi:hypothetical protein
MEDTNMFTQSHISDRSTERRVLGKLVVICGLLIVSGAAMPIVTGEFRVGLSALP